MNSKSLNIRKQQVFKLFNELGVVDGSFYLFNRLCSLVNAPVFCIKYYFVAQLLSQEKILPLRRGNKINIKYLPVSFQYNHPCPRPVEVIQDRYSQGAVCLSAFKEGEFAGCLWYIKGKYKEDEVRCCYELVSDISVWDFDVYVEPKYRLSPVFLKLWDEVSQRLISEGYQYSVSRISAFNAMSLSSHRRMGAKQLGWAVFLCMGFAQFTLSNLFPYIHISFSSASFPLFKLNTQNNNNT